MKPREGFIFLAIVTNIIGVAIAQESLFECPRGKIFINIFFLIQVNNFQKVSFFLVIISKNFKRNST